MLLTGPQVAEHAYDLRIGLEGRKKEVREFDAVTAIGDAVNLAHRLLENARPGEIVISEESLIQCAAQLNEMRHRVRVIAREQLQVKGKKEPVAVCRLGREG